MILRKSTGYEHKQIVNQYYLISKFIPSQISNNFGSVIISSCNILQIAGNFLKALLSLATSVSSETMNSLSVDLLFFKLKKRSFASADSKYSFFIFSN